jgi:site-specific recombinase XerD
MDAPQPTCYPFVADVPTARVWLQIQVDLGRSRNTVDAYGRDLNDYLAACQRLEIHAPTATRRDIARYVRDLRSRPNPRYTNLIHLTSGAGLSLATIQRRLTVVRLYYDYLIEEELRTHNPVGRGQYTAGAGGARQSARGLLLGVKKQPWIPNEHQWLDILHAVVREPIRNRLMFALAYDCALRREELCRLATTDIEPGKRLIHIRGETTKNGRAREVVFSAPTMHLYTAYLVERRQLSRARGPLFLSMSNQNKAHPISIWTWSKVVQQIAQRAGLPQLTTHTTRHLCLTDLARAGWDIHEIAHFAGHQSIQSTMRYIHRSGRDLLDKVDRGMKQIHAWRVTLLAEGME